MIQVPVYWWSNRGDVHPEEQWDTGLLHHLFSGNLRPIPDIEFPYRFGRIEPGSAPGVVVIGGRHHVHDVDELNADLAHLHGVVLIIVGDEEGVFPWRQVDHPLIQFWVQMPRPGVHDDMAAWAFFFGNGYHPDTRRLLAHAVERDLDWVFAGQNTHPRRRQAVDGLRKASKRTNGVLLTTGGFGQGLERADYLTHLARAKVAPCPSGPFTPDTFRVYEALEAGAFPIVDERASKGDPGYWRMAYGDQPPFPVVDDWDTVGGHIEAALATYPEPNVRASAWWSQRKLDLPLRLVADLATVHLLDGLPEPMAGDDVTILVTTSPTSRDDAVAMIDETVRTARTLLPCAPLVLAADGVRPEQQHLAQKYAEDLEDVAHYVHHVWRNAVLDYNGVWLHQALTTRRALAHVHTSTILAIEHDTPLVVDEPIDMELAVDVVRAGFLDVLRFHHEAAIHPEHRHMMIDHHTRHLLELPIRRTFQWSQRPFLTNADYYRRTLAANFTIDSRTMIEDKMHSVAASNPWAKNRIAIYHPETGNIKRSFHLDGRGDSPKYEMRF